MLFNKLPIEVIIVIFKYFTIEELERIHQVLPHAHKFLVYIKYSQSVITVSKSDIDDLTLIVDDDIKIHPKQVIIDKDDLSVRSLLPYLVRIGCKITIKVRDNTMTKVLDMCHSNDYRLDLVLDTESPIEMPPLNIHRLKILGNLVLPFTKSLKHLDLSFTGLTDTQLAAIDMPPTLESINRHFP